MPSELWETDVDTPFSQIIHMGHGFNSGATTRHLAPTHPDPSFSTTNPHTTDLFHMTASSVAVFQPVIC